MRRVDRRIDRDLTRIADCASPSPDAWASIRSRIEQLGGETEREVIMLDTRETHAPTRPRWRLLAVAAAVAVLAVAGWLVAGSSDDDRMDIADAGDAPAVVQVDGDTYELTDLGVCFQDPGARDNFVLHVIGDGPDDLYLELSFFHEGAELSRSGAEEFNGRVTVREGASSQTFTTQTAEPWPYLDFVGPVASAELEMDDAAGEPVDVAFRVRCG